MSSVKTILVAGTSKPRRKRTSVLLTQAGHSVAEVETIEGAIAYVAAEAPPLVILDTDLSGRDDLDLCHRIETVSPETFILQISQTFSTNTGAPVEIAGCIDAYLVDPIDPQEMLTLVRSLLRLQQVEADLRDSEERLVLAQEAAGLAILDWAIPSNSFVHSADFLTLFDLPRHEPGAVLDPAFLLERIHPDDLAALVAGFSLDSQTTRSFEKEFRIIRRDGETRWISSRGRFFIAQSGQPERMLSLSLDVTERKIAERANAELASIVATSVDAILSVDLAGNATSWNAGAERLFGVSASAMIGKPLETAFGDIADHQRDEYRRRLADGEAHDFEMKQKRITGEPLDIWVTSAPMRSPEGKVIGSSFIIRDVSAHKQREDHVRFLMRELTHRSKNLLAVIQAMARQSLTGGITPEEFVRRFTNRLAGLAGSHDLLSSVDWRGASLMDLIRSQLKHYEELFGVRIVLDGTDVLLRPEAAQNIGIALHELSTNAAKYGALSNETGRVIVAWRITETSPRMLHLSWTEKDGPPVAAPSRQGFGSVVMNRIAGTALGGKSAISFENEGVAWTLEVPAAAAVTA